jgi:hypothetical protein
MCWSSPDVTTPGTPARVLGINWLGRPPSWLRGSHGPVGLDQGDVTFMQMGRGRAWRLAAGLSRRPDRPPAVIPSSGLGADNAATMGFRL